MRQGLFWGPVRAAVSRSEQRKKGQGTLDGHCTPVREGGRSQPGCQRLACIQHVSVRTGPGPAPTKPCFPPTGVITAVAFVLVCLLLLALHYMYRHKGTYHTNEAKGTEFAESADAALQDDPSLQDSGDNSRKEYFI